VDADNGTPEEVRQKQPFSLGNPLYGLRSVSAGLSGAEIGRRQLVAPGGPAVTRFASKQFEVGAGDETLDALVNAIRLAAMFAARF
jgi:hypothetical protein